jgi:hypothetical protein
MRGWGKAGPEHMQDDRLSSSIYNTAFLLAMTAVLPFMATPDMSGLPYTSSLEAAPFLLPRSACSGFPAFATALSRSRKWHLREAP